MYPNSTTPNPPYTNGNPNGFHPHYPGSNVTSYPSSGGWGMSNPYIQRPTHPSSQPPPQQFPWIQRPGVNPYAPYVRTPPTTGHPVAYPPVTVTPAQPVSAKPVPAPAPPAPPVPKKTKEERRTERLAGRQLRRVEKLAKYDLKVVRMAERRAVKAQRREEKEKKRQAKKENQELQELMEKLAAKAASNPSSEKQQKIRELAALIAASSSSSSSSSSGSEDSDSDDDMWLHQQLLNRKTSAEPQSTNASANVNAAETPSKSRWFKPFGGRQRHTSSAQPDGSVQQQQQSEVDAEAGAAPGDARTTGDQWAQFFANPESFNRLVANMVSYIVAGAQSVQTGVQSGVQSGVNSIQQFDRNYVAPATERVTPCLNNIQTSIKEQQPELDKLLKNIQETFEQAVAQQPTAPTTPAEAATTTTTTTTTATAAPSSTIPRLHQRRHGGFFRRCQQQNQTASSATQPLEEANPVPDHYQPQRLLPQELAAQFMKAFTDAVNIALPMASTAALTVTGAANRALGFSPQQAPQPATVPVDPLQVVSNQPTGVKPEPVPATPTATPQIDTAAPEAPETEQVPVTPTPNFDDMDQYGFTEYMLRQIEKELIAASAQQQNQQEQEQQQEQTQEQKQQQQPELGSSSTSTTSGQPTVKVSTSVGDVVDETPTIYVDVDFGLGGQDETVLEWDLVIDDIPPHLASVLQSSQSLFKSQSPAQPATQASAPASAPAPAPASAPPAPVSVQPQTPAEPRSCAQAPAQAPSFLPVQPDGRESTPISSQPLDRDPIITIVDIPHPSKVTIPVETLVAAATAPSLEESLAPPQPQPQPQVQAQTQPEVPAQPQSQSDAFVPTRVIAASKEAEFESLFAHSDELYKQRQHIVATFRRLEAEGKGPQDGRLRLLNEHLRKIDLMIEKTQASIQQLIGDADFDAELEQLGISMQ